MPVSSRVYPVNPGDHSPAKLRTTFEASLKGLKVQKVRTLYLHAPDRATPFEETCAEVDKLHKEGKFEQFGLSNFAAWEVAEVVMLCRSKGWVQPKIYQCELLRGRSSFCGRLTGRCALQLCTMPSLARRKRS